VFVDAFLLYLVVLLCRTALCIALGFFSDLFRNIVVTDS